MKLQLSVLVIALLNTQLSHGRIFSQSEETSTKAYHSRITGQLLSGGEQQLGGFGDAMMPLMQNQNNLLFADGTVMLGQELRSTTSGGLGYRGIKQAGLGQGILGAYLFSDYYQTRLKNNYWQLNPGLEWLNERYEARLQGYIPLSRRNQTYRHTYADDIPERVLKDSGKSNHLGGALGHSLIDTPVNLLEEFGPGVELEAGHFIDYGKGFWLRAGGYHFSYNHAKNINGVEGNIEAFINDHMSLLLQNNYDNQNQNRFAIGLRVNFDGSSAQSHSLERRMTTPIIRHLARQSYGDALPTRRSFQANGPTTVLFNNVWFFSPDGTLPRGRATTLANCTAEHPCSTIDTPTAAQIALLTPDAQLFFETGEYNILPNAINQNNWVNLHDGQSFLGRNTGWITAATGNNRPLINGSLRWGNTDQVIASGAIYNMRVNNATATSNTVSTAYASNSSTSNSVMSVSAFNNMALTRTTINAKSSGSIDGTGSNNATYGIQTATIADSIINAITRGNATNGAGNPVFGIVANNALVTGKTMNTKNTGTIDGKSTTGVLSIVTSNQLIFQSNTASFIKAISLNGTQSISLPYNLKVQPTV